MSFDLDREEFDEAVKNKDFDFIWSAYEELRFQAALSNEFHKQHKRCFLVVKELYDAAHVGGGKFVCPPAFNKVVKMASDVIQRDPYE